MKIQIIVLTVILGSSLNAQIIDGNFEKWDTAFHWVLPVNSQYELIPRYWKSNNEIHPDWHPFLVSTPASQSEESPFDEFSLKLESSATISIDESGTGILYQDIPSKKLDQISFWMKCDSILNDAGCYIELYGINNTLNLIYKDSIIEQQTNFENYIIRPNPSMVNDYDSIRIQFIAKGYNGLGENYVSHTQMLIDKVEVEYLSNIEQLETNKLNIFPNPTDDKISIESKGQEIKMIQLINSDGKIIKKVFYPNNINTLEIKNFAKGVYILKTTFMNNHYQLNKIIKN